MNTAHDHERALFLRRLADADPDVAGAIAAEMARQESGIELIASENFVSVAVLEAAGSSPYQQVRGRLSG